MQIFTIAILVFALSCSAPMAMSQMPVPLANALPRVHVDGLNILDAAGKSVTLRGVNLGNWLLIEPGGLGGAIGKFPDQQTLFNTLRDRFGAVEQRRLIDVYRDHYMTERDVEMAKAFRFNLLRVGFDYSIFEDDDRPMHLREGAFRYTDHALEWAEKHGMYVLFDLHGAQGRQVRGKQSGDNNRSDFWDSEAFQERSLWLWEQIARRYKGRTNVLGYEALNEPWGKSPAALRDYCARWYQRVRPIDGDAVLVFPGWYGDVSFYGRPADNGWANAMFDMHFYPGQFGSGKAGPEAHVHFLNHALQGWRDGLAKLGAPMLIGELKVVYQGPGSAEFTRRYFDYCKQSGWAITLWTWKELRATAKSPVGEWMLATNRDTLSPVDFNTSSKEELEAFFVSLSTMPLVVDEGIKHWLTTADKPPALTPTTKMPELPKH